jgi:ferredoxin
MQRCLLNLRDLLDEALGGVPQAVAGRCVHERASAATCRHCVTACPRDAWQLDDEQLMIDIGRCDGCGICVAKCPGGALTQVGVSPEPYLGSVELRLSCERVTSDSGDWRLPCLHAVGPVWLTSLYRAGLRHIVWDVSHCQTCDRSNDDGLPQSVEQLNAVLGATRAASDRRESAHRTSRGRSDGRPDPATGRRDPESSGFSATYGPCDAVVGPGRAASGAEAIRRPSAAGAYGRSRTMRARDRSASMQWLRRLLEGLLP